MLSLIDFSKISKVEGEGLILSLNPSVTANLQFKKFGLSFTHTGKKKDLFLEEGDDILKLQMIFKCLQEPETAQLEEEIRKITGYLERPEEEWGMGRVTGKIYETLKNQYESKLIKLHEEYKWKVSQSP